MPPAKPLAPDVAGRIGELQCGVHVIYRGEVLMIAVVMCTRGTHGFLRY